MGSKKSGAWALAGGALAVGVVFGYVLGAREPNPSLRNLDASLWLQTSPEYRALCLQTYHLAEAALVRAKARTEKDDRPLAVVMDLDETVLDNSAYQTGLYEGSTTYSDDTWRAWERDGAADVRAVPGAVEFIRFAAKEGVTPVFISNRSDSPESLAGAVKALEKVGVPTDGVTQRLLFKGKAGSDKTPRREEAEKKYRVLMYFGDTLTDFHRDFASPRELPDDAAGSRALVAKRYKPVEENRAKWGETWFVLPNPVYGDFTRIGARNPLDVMNRRGAGR